MPPDERALALGYIDQLALLGIEARYPLASPLRGKLYELRWKAGRKQFRIVYFAAGGHKFVLLHGFVKKSPATPKGALEICRDRLREYEGR